MFKVPDIRVLLTLVDFMFVGCCYTIYGHLFTDAVSIILIIIVLQLRHFTELLILFFIAIRPQRVVAQNDASVLKYES